MAKVRITNASVFQGFPPGSVQTVSSSIARRMVAAGAAEMVEDTPTREDVPDTPPITESGLHTGMIGGGLGQGGDLLRSKIQKG